MKIPINDMHIKKFSETRYGHVYAHETTIPAQVVTSIDGTITISLHEGADNLGEYLLISQQLTKEQIEKLLKKESVRL